MDELAVADDRIEERAAPLAAHVLAAVVAEDHEVVRALGDGELGALDPGERLEGRTGRAAAVRAVAVPGVTNSSATA
jgi:hypothetical protein